MQAIASRLLVTIHGVAAGAAGSLLVAAVAVPWRLSLNAGLSVVLLLAMITLARIYPFQLTPKTNTTLATVPLFAAVLLLSAPLAMGVAAVGALLGERIRRRVWFQAEFNVAEVVLRLGVSAAILSLVAGQQSLFQSGWLQWVTGMGAVAVTMYLVNALLVELIVGVQLRHFSARQFLRRRRGDVMLETTLFLLGAVVAQLGAITPWTLVAVGGLGALVYRLLRTRALRANPLGQSAKISGTM